MTGRHSRGPEADGSDRTPLSKRTLGIRYAARAAGLLVAGLLVLFATTTAFVDDDGNTRAGVPDMVVVVLMAIGGLLAVFGIVALLNSARIAYVLLRYPWVEVRSRFAELGGLGTPNGQPVLTIGDGAREWHLTLGALRWRWSSFDAPTLFFAGRSGKAGVVAPPSRRTIAWAGRSLMTALVMKFRAGRA